MGDEEYVESLIQQGEDRGLLWGLFVGLLIGASGVAGMWWICTL